MNGLKINFLVKLIIKIICKTNPKIQKINPAESENGLIYVDKIIMAIDKVGNTLDTRGLPKLLISSFG